MRKDKRDWLYWLAYDAEMAVWQYDTTKTIFNEDRGKSTAPKTGMANSE